MTASKLEESIREIVETTGLNSNWSLGASKRLEDALRAFAEAIAAKASEVREKPKNPITEKCVFKCSCGKENDITDIVYGGLVFMGCDWKETIRCQAFYRTHNMDWPPKEKPPEPKESRGCAEFCDCKSPAALPDEVKAKMREIFLNHRCATPSEMTTWLEELARLCLSLRKP